MPKKKNSTKNILDDHIEILTETLCAPLINRSKRAGGKFIHYILGRHGVKLYVKIIGIEYARGTDESEGGPKGIGTYIKRWVPLDVFFGGLVDWHDRGSAHPATYMLPTPKTRDFYHDPGVLRVNSTLRGHLVAIFRGEGLLRAKPGICTLAGSKELRARAGYLSVPGHVAPACYFTERLSMNALRSEPFDPERDVYKALTPQVDVEGAE